MPKQRNEIICYVEASFVCPCNELRPTVQHYDSPGHLKRPKSILHETPNPEDFIPLHSTIKCAFCGAEYHWWDDREKIKLKIIDWYMPLSNIHSEVNQAENLLKRLRVESGLSQDELAEKLNISRPTLALYENRTIKHPRARIIESFADFFNVDKDEIAKSLMLKEDK